MNVKETLMALAISLLAAFFVGLFLDAVYEAPEYDDFCIGEERAKPFPESQKLSTDCDDPYFIYQTEIDQCYETEGSPEFEYDEQGCMYYSACNTCQKEFKEAASIYNRNLFYIILPIALFAVLFGLFYSFEVVGSGFMFSGILLLIYGTIRHFSDMSKLMRTLVMFLGLVLLVFIASKKMRPKKK